MAKLTLGLFIAMTNPLYKGKAQLKRPSGKDGIRPGEELGRSAFRKDYARLLHAPSFRRLQGKTQLFPGAESDYFRNRLTHSLEVAQIARGIAAKLNSKDIKEHFAGGSISEDLVEFAAIAHDLGHPPFGHNGEYALDELMRQHGGFEGNAQTLRILSAVERKLVKIDGERPTADVGLDLTYRSLASVLKYDSLIPATRDQAEKLHKGYYSTESELVKNIRKKVAPGLPAGKKFKTIECAIMDIADDIAYSTYDLEDSLHAGFITPLGLASALANNVDVRDQVMGKTNRALKESKHKAIEGVAEILRVIVEVFGIKMPPTVIGVLRDAGAIDDQNALMANLESWMSDQALCSDELARTQFTAERVGRLIMAVELVPNVEFPQLSQVRLDRKALLQVEVLKHLNYELIIRAPRLAVVEHRGKGLVTEIFTALEESDGALLPSDWKERYTEERTKGLSQTKRVICDYVACMTDRYAAETYARLFGEGATIFKPI